MGLLITLQEGDDFYIDDREFEVALVIHDRCYVLREVETGDLFEVTDDRATEVLKDVHISAATRPREAVLNIQAPRKISIVRGKAKRRNQR